MPKGRYLLDENIPIPRSTLERWQQMLQNRSQIVSMIVYVYNNIQL